MKMLMHHIHFLLKILKGRAKQIFWPDFGAAAVGGATKTAIVVSNFHPRCNRCIYKTHNSWNYQLAKSAMKNRNLTIIKSNNNQRSMLSMGKCCLYHFKSNFSYDDTTNRPLKTAKQ